MKKTKTALLRNLAILIVSLLLLVTGSGFVYTDHLLSKINYVPDPAESKAQTGPLFDGTDSGGTESAKSGMLGGLYHDDAVTNILLLGVDNYQVQDAGRSDSMMLVSVDTRHKKLKTTSFLRDMYVAIPGHGSNKLNAAYSSNGGKVNGAEGVASTIEANFGVDVDRFVIIDFDAFPKIIDRLGGVTITLTNEKDGYGRTEADLINKYSKDPKKVHTGVNNLTGLQARYYARIRDIGDDYERTQRQRKIFESIVSKMKTSSLPTILGVLSDTLPLVTTNMTKNEVVSMAQNSLTYLNYPVSEHRVPADDEFQSKKVYIGKSLSDVLVPDLDKCRQSLAAFLYESDLPSKVYD